MSGMVKVVVEVEGILGQENRLRIDTLGFHDHPKVDFCIQENPVVVHKEISVVVVANSGYMAYCLVVDHLVSAYYNHHNCFDIDALD